MRPYSEIVHTSDIRLYDLANVIVLVHVLIHRMLICDVEDASLIPLPALSARESIIFVATARKRR